MKQTKKKLVYEVIIDKGMSITTLIDILNDVVKEEQHKYDYGLILSVQEQTYSNFNGPYYYLEILGVRSETDEEYKNRIAKEREEKKRIKQEIEEEVIRKRLQRFKLYQELKKEFENETNLSR